MDPFAKESRRQLYLKKDTITYLVKAGECVRWDELVSKAAGKAGSRLVWRPPKDFIIKSNGSVYSDDRGLFAKYLGHKVVFRNKMNAPLRIKATVPVGKISDPTKIFARPVVVDETADPSGHKKDLSRKRGKKGQKNYSKATDRVEINVTEKQLFTGDANLYSLFIEKTPGDQLAAPTYYANGFTLLDYIPILPNENQYSGGKFSADLIVMEIVIVVRYIVSRIVPADGAISATTQDFYKAELTNFESVYHVDEESFLTKQLGQTGAVSPGQTTTMQLEDQGYPYVGLCNKDSKLQLCCYDNDKVVGPPVELTAYKDDKFVRLVIPGLHCNSAGGDVLTSEFGYDSEAGAWVLFDGNQPRVADVDLAVAVDSSVVSSAIPVHLYTVVRRFQPGLVQARDGLVRNYGEGLTYAITWSQIAQGLSVVLKVLPLVLQIGGILFG